MDLRNADLRAEGKNVIGEGSKLSGKISLGYASTLGRYSNLFGGTIDIGRYCQFGPCVAIYALNHPYTHLTSYVNNQLFEGRMKQHQKGGDVLIGSDVWIGHGAVILPGVVVGDGAAIGAGAIVTKNVEEFSIAVGNPARCVGRRFPDEIVETVKLLKWWERSPEELLEIEELFHLDLAENPALAAEKLQDHVSALSTVK